MDRIVVTGMGIISAAGRGVEATYGALAEGRAGLGPLTRFASPRCGGFPVAEARGVELACGEPAGLALGRAALEEALRSAGLEGAPEALRERAALVIGQCVGGMPESEEAVALLQGGGEPDPAVWLRHECAHIASALAGAFELRGPTMTISNACASGVQALATGAELLRAGEADLVLAGGADALCRLTLNGFASLLAMDPDGCRPFDRNRRGMSLGEGAAFVVLEPERAARARGARPLAALAGWASTCDAYHATAPRPDGSGARDAMRLALEAARLAPEQVGYINAHGTGTPDNDRAEGRALRAVFGERVPPFSSSKRLFGHTLAAAGALESVVAILAIERGLLPGTPGFGTPDPDCGVEPLRAAREARPAAVLSSSFGFGGQNAVACFTAPEAP